MAQFNVGIGNGQAGDTITVTATDEKAARAAAVFHPMMTANPGWVVETVDPA